MVYTCYEMIRDCRAGKSAGWSYLIAHYVPVMRRLRAHYFPEQQDEGRWIERVLTGLQSDSGLFENMDPAPERDFVCELRQKVLASAERADDSGCPPLEVLSAACEPLTMMEKEAVWFETMRYSAADAGRMLRIDPRTAGSARERAAELIRGQLDRWHRTLLADAGFELGAAAAAAATDQCATRKALVDILDGRATWAKREELERHVTACWHCVDHLCRLHESGDILRSRKPLTEEEAEPLRQLLHVETQKPSRWRRMRGAGQ
jgi:hypothetical protein